MNGAIAARPGRLGHRSGAERGRQHRAAGGRDRGALAGRVRGHLRQRRLDRRHRGRAEAVAGAHPWLRQIRHARSCGQSAALRTGWRRRGRRSSSRSTATARTIRRFFPAADRCVGAGRPRIGLVAGQRVGRKASALQAFQSRIANAVRGAILRDGTRDSGCGLKAFPRDLGWRCRISTACIASCRRWSGAKATTSAMST